MNYNKVRDMLSHHEGRVNHAYQDSLGYWTIGVGHLVDGRLGGKLPDHIVDALLDYDIQKTSQDLFRQAPWILNLDEVRQAVLVDMAHNLGVAGLLKFKRTLASVQAGEYERAAEEMLESLWARQVKTRATRLAQMMRSGEWPNDVRWSN